MLELAPMFFCMHSIYEFSTQANNQWTCATLAVIQGQIKTSSKGKKESTIANGEREFDQDVISIGVQLKK